MSDESKFCEINATDQRPAQFVFTDSNGSEHYICHVHVEQYAKDHPDSVKSKITA
jgi:hypothetical protein